MRIRQAPVHQSDTIGVTPIPQALVVRSHPLAVGVGIAARLVIAALALAVAGAAGVSGPAITTLVGLATGSVVVGRWARWRADTLTLSRDTLTVRRGLVARYYRVIPVDAVHDVATKGSLAGWVFGYGELRVRLQSGGSLRLSPVPAPEIVREQILAARLDNGPVERAAFSG